MDFSIQFNFPTNLTNILTIYKHTLNSYVLNALITWRRAITDDATIRKLLNLIISRMSNILFHISKVVQESSISRKSPPLDVPTNIIRDNFLLDPLNLLHLYSWGKKMKIYGELSRLMDSSWKISSSLYPNSLFNVLAHSEEGRTAAKNNWRHVIANFDKDTQQSEKFFGIQTIGEDVKRMMSDFKNENPSISKKSK